MIDLFYELRYPIGGNKILSVSNKILEIVINKIYPIYNKINKPEYGLNSVEKRKNEIIVSLTSFPARLEKIHLCISSLLRQSCKPDKIMLWLYEGECKKEELPKTLLELVPLGLEIRFCKENIKPHKKYYYTAKEFSESIIVTVDDDNLYPSWLIEKLYATHILDQANIICTISRKIQFVDDKIVNYENWTKQKINGSDRSHLRVAIGAGGVLYPPQCMDSEYFDINKLKTIALDTDDLWAKFAELRMKRMVHVINNNELYPISILGSQRKSLKHNNVGLRRNDVNTIKLIEVYPECYELLKKSYYQI